ncbi:MAG: hypothetical protein Q4B88_01860 [Moraxella sp.]|nr:hypothetical protein [Moraxella sp.]
MRIIVNSIRHDDDLTAAFSALKPRFQAKAGTPKADARDGLLVLIGHYENQAYLMPNASPLAAIHLVMQQQGLTQEGLNPYLGAKSKVLEILSKKRTLQPFYDKKAPARLKNPV